MEILSHLKPVASQADAVDPEAAVRRKSLLASMEKAAATAKRYDSEKGDIKKEAEQFEAAAEANGKINDRCDHAALSLQIAVVICSVAILSRWRLFWYIGLGLGVAGALIGMSAFRL